MKTSLIIGAGQLGSRHLQGMLKCNESQIIHVLDPSELSIHKAKTMESEIEHNHKVIYHRRWIDLPSKFDIVIVATNADVREAVTTNLLQNYSVRALILEKILFQDIQSYERVSNLIEKHRVKTWVNHPRRMYKQYQYVQEQVDIQLPKVYQVTGGNWGLACNALHYIDLFIFLSGSRLRKIDADWVDNELQQSKRFGFIEFTGTVKGLLENGSIFQVTSLKGNSSYPTVTIFDEVERFIIQEGLEVYYYQFSKGNNFNAKVQSFNTEFQSSLTSRLVTDIYETGGCDLPDYEVAFHSHILFISALQEKYNQIIGIKSKTLPIT